MHAFATRFIWPTRVDPIELPWKQIKSAGSNVAQARRHIPTLTYGSTWVNSENRMVECGWTESISHHRSETLVSADSL